MGTKGFVIAGAGQCGAWIARTLRQNGAVGAITLLGDEPHLPYERPPLSKEALNSSLPIEHGNLFSPAELLSLQITIQVGIKATAIDRDHQVVSTTGGHVDYKTLFLATGSRSRILSQALPGPRVLYLRTREDSHRIQQCLESMEPLLVIGGGWIGLEVASVAAQRGIDVTVIEQESRLCARVLSPQASSEILALHLKYGVKVRLGSAITNIKQDATGVTVTMSDGTIVQSGWVVVGVGGLPNDEIAINAKLRTDAGIIVDRFGRTDDPNIFAAGDVARIEDSVLGLLPRFESWANAQDQAIATAKAALGIMQPYTPTPWFWSTQYDCQLQLAGIYHPEQTVLHRTGLDDGSWIQVGIVKGEVHSVCAMRSPRDFRLARSLIGTFAHIDPDIFSDVSQPISKSVVHALMGRLKVSS